MDPSKEKIVMRVAWNTIVINALLTLGKLAAGVMGHSAAMVSDAVHSMSDVASTIVVMVGVKMAGKPADGTHPYGHERFESVAAFILAGILCATGLGIGYGGIRSIAAGNYEQMVIPGTVALAAAVVSILIKEGMYWYTRAAAKKTGSDALMADAWHHRSDALSSIGSFTGILGARMGFPVLDSVAALGISFFIVKVAYDIFRESVSKLTDCSLDVETVEAIRALALTHEAVKSVDKIRTRIFGDRVYADMEISLDGDMTLRQAHAVAHEVHDSIETSFPRIKHCIVHVNAEDTCRMNGRACLK